MKILIAEDRAVSRRILQELVEKQGHEVRVTENGRQAWEAFENSPAEVILTDWDMPEWDGLQLTKQVRSKPENHAVYIIILSAVYTLNENFYQAMDLGVNDFMTKPYTKRDLIVRLRLAEKAINSQRKIEELENILSICSYCKKIRDGDDGEWRPIEEHMQKRDGTLMSHGMCPGCHAQMMKELESGG